MTETPRDRAWIAALAVARTRGTFAAGDVLDVADLSGDRRDTVEGVLGVMERHGYLARAEDGTGWRARAPAPSTDANPDGFDGTFTYLAAPNTRWTFEPDAVREWVESRLEGRTLNLFAGRTRLRHDGEVVRNDLDGSIDADYHVDARAAADHFDPGSFDTVVLDPPLPGRWVDGEGPGGPGALRHRQVENGVAELVRASGRTITFGRDSSGMGAGRGFETEEICLINHPGAFQDTIAVVERRTGTAVPGGRG